MFIKNLFAEKFGTKTVRALACVFSCILFTACTSESLSITTGTWKDAASNRYITIEAGDQAQLQTPGAAKQYTVTLFSYYDKNDTGPNPDLIDPSSALASAEGLSSANAENVIRLDRQFPATIKDGVLTLEAGAGSVPVLYHPTGERILVNGVNEFIRVNEAINM